MIGFLKPTSMSESADAVYANVSVPWINCMHQTLSITASRLICIAEYAGPQLESITTRRWQP